MVLNQMEFQKMLKAFDSYDLYNKNSSGIFLTMTIKMGAFSVKKKKDEKFLFSSLRTERVYFPNSFKKKPSIAVYDPSSPFETKDSNGTAIYYGSHELIDQILRGSIHIDFLLCQSSHFLSLKRYSKDLGPKKLMPNKKNGTLTDNIETSVYHFNKSFSPVYVNNKNVIYIQIGLADMLDSSLYDNYLYLNDWIKKVLPVNIHRSSIKSISIQRSFGPSFLISQ